MKIAAKTVWYRALIFFIIGLPMTWEEVKKYWWAVTLWIAIVIFTNIFLLDTAVKIIKNH